MPQQTSAHSYRAFTAVHTHLFLNSKAISDFRFSMSEKMQLLSDSCPFPTGNPSVFYFSKSSFCSTQAFPLFLKIQKKKRKKSLQISSNLFISLSLCYMS